jgi:hypothetical protein
MQRTGNYTHTIKWLFGFNFNFKFKFHFNNFL